MSINKHYVNETLPYREDKDKKQPYKLKGYKLTLKELRRNFNLKIKNTSGFNKS